MLLATEEKALLAFEPTRRIVPTTKTKITASITAYSAMSWPRSSVQSWGRILICLQFLSTAKIRTLGWKCQRQERPSAAGSGIRNLVLISLWRLCSRAPAMSIEWTAMPNSVLGATFSRFKHWRCLAFCALRISRAIDLGHQEQTPERIHPCGSLFCNTRTGRVRSSRMSRSFRLLLEKTGGGGIASVENYLEPALPLLFESFFNFLDFFVLC